MLQTKCSSDQTETESFHHSLLSKANTFHAVMGHVWRCLNLSSHHLFVTFIGGCSQFGPDYTVWTARWLERRQFASWAQLSEDPNRPLGALFCALTPLHALMDLYRFCLWMCALQARVKKLNFASRDSFKWTTEQNTMRTESVHCYPHLYKRLTPEQKLTFKCN